MSGLVTGFYSQVGSTNGHDIGLDRGVGDLRKERALAQEAKHIGDLEVLVQQLQDDLTSLEAEASRLRKSNEDLSKRIQRESDEHAEQVSHWLEKEQDLLKIVRGEKAKNKELREILDAKSAELQQSLLIKSLNSSPEYAPPSPSHTDDDEPSSPSYVKRTSSPPPRSMFEIQEENMKLRSQLQDLTSRLVARETQIRKQDQEIVELQRTVAALMDELESGFDQAMFNYVHPDGAPIDVDADIPPELEDVDMGMSGKGHGSSSTKARDRSLSTASAHGRSLFDELNKLDAPKSEESSVQIQSSEQNNAPTISAIPMDSTPSVSSTTPNDSAMTTTTKSSNSSDTDNDHDGDVGHSPTAFSSLADELDQLGEMKFNFATSRGEPGSLRSRLAALGLNTDGNRRILKKRLQVYIKRKQAALQRQHENGSHMYGALSPNGLVPQGFGNFASSPSPPPLNQAFVGAVNSRNISSNLNPPPILASAPASFRSSSSANSLSTGSSTNAAVGTASPPSPPPPVQSVTVH